MGDKTAKMLKMFSSNHYQLTNNYEHSNHDLRNEQNVLSNSVFNMKLAFVLHFKQTRLLQGP